MARLLVVHHSPTRSVQALTAAALEGARDEELRATVEVVERPALEATAADVLAADSVLLVTPANFGYMSGALKHFFDSTFLEIGGALGEDGQGAGAPGGGRTAYGLCVHGRYDTAGAVRAVQSIVGALPWRQAAPVLEVLGEVTDEHLGAARELGATLGAVVA